jgi:uncharacterized protein
MRNSDKRTSNLAEVLKSASDVLFPAEPGKTVGVDSTGPCGDTPLHVMARRGNVEAVRLLIDAGADVNAIGEMGETPLHVAVHKGYVAIADALLNSGASKSICSEFGKTPSELAAELGGSVAATFKRSRRDRRQLLHP